MCCRDTKGGKQIGKTKKMPQEATEEQLVEENIMSVQSKNAVVLAKAKQEKASVDDAGIFSMQTEKEASESRR